LSRIGWRAGHGFPDVLVLIATGTILGPILHWIDTSKFESFAHGFGNLRADPDPV